MERRTLGRTGAQVSVLGIGDLADRSVPLHQCMATLHRAMDHGLNLVDTAPGYENGYSEQIVGAALNGRREGMFVIDKIDDLVGPVAPQVEASLRTLGIETVDLFAFHEVSRGTDCLHYTLTLNPDVTLLGMSFPNEQDAVLAAYESFCPLSPSTMTNIEKQAAHAIAGKGTCWWNPAEAET
jgi:hypothetical protein